MIPRHKYGTGMFDFREKDNVYGLILTMFMFLFGLLLVLTWISTDISCDKRN